MDLQPTRVEYELADESGYKFRVIAEYGGEFSCWSATLYLSTQGLRTPEGAVKMLVTSAQEFIRMTSAGALGVPQ